MSKTLVQSKSHHYLRAKPAWLVENLDDYLPEELAIKAREELNEMDETKVEKLEKLKIILKNEPDLNPRLDDSFLLHFLRVAKFDVAKAFKQLQNYYRLRLDYPEVFAKANPENVLGMIEDGMISILPFRNREGTITIVFKTSNWDVNVHSVEDYFALVCAVAEWTLLSTETQISGVKMLWDIHNFSFTQMFILRPKHIMFISKLLMKTLPFRFKKIVIIRENSVFNVVFQLLKPLLSKKIYERVVMLGNDFATLHNYIDSDILPGVYGGKTKQITNEEFIAEFLKSQPELDYNNTFGYLRSAKQANPEAENDEIEKKIVEHAIY